ncbi:MAG: DNA topoisomerase (ATP-hydrolyzing) subunit A [Acutalibacteraceae bacterium]|nr:DNA topoisomerase (ATP-hydrolyzing) subunit A [Acutalibacteraceae bacterium]
MAKKQVKNKQDNSAPNNAYIEGAGTIVEKNVVDTLETNYMPYAMSVIVSRAIPEIDGFKPSHRKLLYTMYGMGLLKGSTIKSANIVGRTMQLNPHGDAAIYDTMVRLSRGNEALLHPYVQSKGSFGKAYSRDMQCAAARYTEAKLEPIAEELFKDIDKDTVDFVDNYDSTMKEPTLFPVSFPSVLVNANMGIAVGMASNICPYNLKEVCLTEIEYLKDNNCVIEDTLIAPDFPSGGQLIYKREDVENIYKTGRGSFKVRAVYSYDKKSNCIDITQIPYTTTVEAIIEKIVDLYKEKKVLEVSDVRDETGLNGLKITIDLKRGTDPDKLMKKLYKLTPLEDSFGVNMNILIGGTPKVVGMRELFEEWTAFRTECVKRRIYFDLSKAKERLHLLKGLKKILLDIDKAIKIVRETEEEKEVVPNLMIGFGIDEVQADYVAEIKLRHLNREYILKRTKDIEELEEKISQLEDTVSNTKKIHKVIISELKEVIDKYSQERKTAIVYPDDEEDVSVEQEVADYPCTLFMTKGGYFKKITAQSLRMSAVHKFKEGDEMSQEVESHNTAHLLFFTNKCQVYKARAYEFDDCKASVMGDFVAAKLGMDQDELPVYMAVTDDYKGNMMFFFDNGKVSKISMSAYQTKMNRKKLIKAYCDKFKLVNVYYANEEKEYLIKSTNGRMLIVSSAKILAKSTKDSQGVAVMTQKKNHCVDSVVEFKEDMLEKPHRYRSRNLPSAGQLMSAEEKGEQMSFI